MSMLKLADLEGRRQPDGLRRKGHRAQSGPASSDFRRLGVANRLGAVSRTPCILTKRERDLIRCGEKRLRLGVLDDEVVPPDRCRVHVEEVQRLRRPRLRDGERRRANAKGGESIRAHRLLERGNEPSAGEEREAMPKREEEGESWGER
eukprot:663374-Pleurochrysis_carterae.AAC.1